MSVALSPPLDAPALPLARLDALRAPLRRSRDARGRFMRALPPRSPSSALDTAGPVLFVVSEMADFIKAGGLGDVAAALPRALRGRCDVRVLIPGYPEVLARVAHMRIVGGIAAKAKMPATRLGLAVLDDGLPVYVLLSPELFDRPGSPYVDGEGGEWNDNALRFACFAHAAAEMAGGRAGLDWVPGLLHLNDWPTALAAAYVRWNGDATPTLLTIHNLAYQGNFPAHVATAIGINPEWLEDVSVHGQVSFLRAGIVHASRINTVSIRYAQQITAREDGCGMEGLLAERASRGHLCGIVNGIDASWDPLTDHHLPAHFNVLRWEGKQENARHVRRVFGLPRSNGPLFAVVSRLVHQKGLDITCDVAPQIVAAGGQIVVIGGGEPQVEAQVTALARRFPGSVAAYIGFEEGLARQMFAAADFLLMPSRFEPCGLSQMYAQRFGCLPIAHATGGLVDTVDDGVTGFLFEGASADGLRRCLQRAMRTFRTPSLLSAMRRAAMLRPSGWEIAGHAYLDLYRRAGGAPAGRLPDGGLQTEVLQAGRLHAGVQRTGGVPA